MLSTVEILVASAAIVVAMPTLVIFIETVAAALCRQTSQLGKDFQEGERPAAGILMPAHDEAEVIERTLAALMPHLRTDDQVLVVADNCTDGTAAIARQFPVTVVERFSDTQRGKGFALAHGIRSWGSNVPDVVVIMDADCHLEPHALYHIVRCAASRQRPAQAVYLMECPKSPTPGDQISAFAFLFKNHVRPLGLHQLGQPCLLTGTGMAFPRSLLNAEQLATGNIVEDMQLGLELAIQGTPPMLVPAATVRGQLPQQSAAATIQRTRWEHGHLQTLLTQVPRLFVYGIRRQRLDLLSLALEMCVPPLSLLVMAWAATCVASVVFYLSTDEAIPAIISATTGGFLLCGILSASWRFGKDILRGKALLGIPWYLCGKVPLYFRFLFRRQKEWIRTQRDAGSRP